jgi:phosphohistidine phosphatase SixA
MRHSEREKKSSSPEREQPLTTVGREHAQAVSDEIRTKLGGAQIELLLASPYRPATETAEIVRKSLGLEATVSTSELLAPVRYSGLDLVKMLSEYSNLGTILLIGHDPQLSTLAERLSSEKPDKWDWAGVRCLEIEDFFGSKARVLWKFNPSELDRSNYHKHQMYYSFYRADPTTGVNINDLDLASLVSYFFQEPYRLGEEEGEITTKTVRSHEWEFLLDVLVVGTSSFATVLTEKFAEKLITWVREQRRQERSKKRDIQSPSEIRVDNRQAVRVDEATIPRDALVQQQMAFATKEGLRVQVILEP